MLLDDNMVKRVFKQRILRSPRLNLKKITKKSRKSVDEEDEANVVMGGVERVGGAGGVTRSCTTIIGKQDSKFLVIPDAGKMLTSRSAEDLSSINHKQQLSDQCCSSSKRRESNFLSTLPVPLSLALGITSLSDSKLYDYHSSQEFLTFLTNSARDVEETRRNNTINTALTQIKELKELVDENTQMLRVVTNTQEYNPTSEIDDVIVQNIAVTLQEHREKVSQMCERAKEYRNQLILAESYLDTNTAQDMKSDLTAMNRNLSYMSMLVRYHTWGAGAVDDNQYHSDDDIISRHRKLDRRNCIRIRERPKWSEGRTTDVVQSVTLTDTTQHIQLSPLSSVSDSIRHTPGIRNSNSIAIRTAPRTNEG